MLLLYHYATFQLSRIFQLLKTKLVLASLPENENFIKSDSPVILPYSGIMIFLFFNS